ncbi:transcriptional regulator [Candidatus Bathyarchaeota archaeon]|nr:transcriptional regulator [Candidatus Bathyarchaeota archaeon]
MICAVCVIVAVWYTITLFFPQLSLVWFKAEIVRFWIVAIPVFIAFVAILAIGAWIGWTMATTPPPRPIEEIEAETMMEEQEEEKE